MANSNIQATIDSMQLQLDAYLLASLAFANNGATQRYSMDTGQDIISVTRAELPQIMAAINNLQNQICMLEARLNRSHVATARPAY